MGIKIEYFYVNSLTKKTFVSQTKKMLEIVMTHRLET